jgi:hypothetical protein
VGTGCRSSAQPLGVVPVPGLRILLSLVVDQWDWGGCPRDRDGQETVVAVDGGWLMYLPLRNYLLGAR